MGPRLGKMGKGEFNIPQSICSHQAPSSVVSWISCALASYPEEEQVIFLLP